MKLGDIHNKVIAKLYELHGDDFFKLDVETMFDLVIPEVAASFPNESIELPDLTELSDRISRLQTTTASESIDVSFAEMKKVIPNADAELNVLKIYAEGLTLVDSEEEATAYYGQFKSIVNSADIPEESNRIIREGLSVGSASNLLWVVE